MSRTPHLLTALVLTASALTAAVAGCEIISSIDRAKLDATGGAGGGTGGATSSSASVGPGGTGGTGGTGGATSSSSSSSGGGGCSSASDCDDGNDCTDDACDNGTCDHTPVQNCAPCTQDSDCPAVECNTASCQGQTCVYVSAAQGDPATDTTSPGDCMKTQCDGNGGTEPVVDATDAPADDGKECTVEECLNGSPSHTPKAAGTACSAGVCDAAGDCFSCTDNTKNGDESDTDCGGSCATKCALGKTCNTANDCANGQCNGGKCVGPTCANGVKDGTETDVDCGGASCAPCAQGSACSAAGDCATGNCVSGICCDTACSGTCQTCAAPFQKGTCMNFPSGYDGPLYPTAAPTCPAGQVCDGSASCAATAKKQVGAACASGADCFNGNCVNGSCKLQTNDWCVDDLECGSNNCVANTCAPCAGNGDCASGTCNAGVCALQAGAVCNGNAECANGSCQFNRCVLLTGGSCTTFADCALHDCKNGVCSPCNTDADCTGMGNSAQCYTPNHFCRFLAGEYCLAQSHCASGTTCTASGTDIYAKCQ